MLALALLLAFAGPLDRDPTWREAEASYNDFEFEAARLAFERLARRRGLSPADVARLQVWIGMCHAEEGALDEAAVAFEEAAVLDPDVEALPFMSPKARRMLEDARKRALKRRPQERPKPLPDPEPALEVPSTAPSTGPPTAAPAPASMSPFVAGGAALLAVGGIAVVSATIAGVAAQGAAAEAVGLDGAAEATARHAAAEQLALGANVGFAVAGVAVIAGAGLLLAGSLD